MQPDTSSAFETGRRDPWHGQNFWAVPIHPLPANDNRPRAPWDKPGHGGDGEE